MLRPGDGRTDLWDGGRAAGAGRRSRRRWTRRFDVKWRVVGKKPRRALHSFCGEEACRSLVRLLASLYVLFFTQTI